MTETAKQEKVNQESKQEQRYYYKIHVQKPDERLFFIFLYILAVAFYKLFPDRFTIPRKAGISPANPGNRFAVLTGSRLKGDGQPRNDSAEK